MPIAPGTRIGNYGGSALELAERRRRLHFHRRSKTMRWNKTRLAILFVLGLPCAGLSQSAGDDAYTRYELLEPASASFRIVYDVTAVTPGERFFFNPIRKGSEARDESVLDRSTGKALRFEVVSGQKARDAGLSTADLETDYIQVYLLRPVPENGEARIRIDKTYRDPKSYFRDGDAIVFDRRLGIKKNIVVLPQNYELLSCNVPSQILEEPYGRIAVSFIKPIPSRHPSSCARNLYRVRPIRNRNPVGLRRRAHRP